MNNSVYKLCLYKNLLYDFSIIDINSLKVLYPFNDFGIQKYSSSDSINNKFVILNNLSATSS